MPDGSDDPRQLSRAVFKHVGRARPRLVRERLRSEPTLAQTAAQAPAAPPRREALRP
jgi:hypothetical protein